MVTTAPDGGAGSHGPVQRGPTVFALFGPTGVGKTAVAVELARRFGARMISCDSMQIYRGFPVLTNQPTDADRRGVAHEFIGVADTEEEWNVADYGRAAQRVIDEDISRHGAAVIAGGTGLYLRAALAPLAVPEAADRAVAEDLLRRAETEGPDALHRELRGFDPEAAERIPATNLRRVIRALEVVRTAGPGAWSGRDDLWAPRYRHPTVLVALEAERSALYRRVDARARSMVREGAVEEVRAHRARVGAGAAGPPRGVRRAIGYREIEAYLEGRLSLEQATERLAAATRRYIRRQTTWMRKLQDAVIIDATHRSPEEVADLIVREAGRGLGRGVPESPSP